MKKWISAKTRNQLSSTTGLLGVTTVGMVVMLDICSVGSGKKLKTILCEAKNPCQPYVSVPLANTFTHQHILAKF